MTESTRWFENPYEQIHEGGEARLLHEIFQRHSLTPTDVYSLGKEEREFLFASMRFAMDMEIGRR